MGWKPRVNLFEIRRHLPQSCIMGRAWGAITLLVGAPNACLGFVPPSVGLVIQRTVNNPCARHSGGISSVSCSTASAFRCRSRREHSLVMMAKGGKGKGKGKAGRMDLIESVAKGTSAKGSGGKEDEDGEEEDGEEAKPAFNVDRLRAETKTPFRTVRIFLYGGFGVSALIGAVTSLSQLAATLTEQPGALELQKVMINLVVDFGVMAASGFCYTFEVSQQEGLEKAVADSREKKRRLKATKITGDVNAERVEQLRTLSVKVPGSGGEGEALQGAKEAPVGVLMDEAKQGFCVLAGGQEFIRDSMLAAMLAKNQIFPSLNLLVVPVDMGASPGDGGKGFGKPLSYEEEGYVAAPVDEEAWRRVMLEELAAAERQGAAKKASDGIVLVMSREGKVLRRGIGVPVWKSIRDDVDPPVKKKDN